MTVLGIDCSATPCSVAVVKDSKVVASIYSNVKITHSQTLMPMVESVIKFAHLQLNDIDAFAVSQGPGSFTGVRIGISAVKGLATPNNKKCVGVSTLEAMAMPFLNDDCIVCCVMDARCNQVYNALFEIKEEKINRLCEDRALMCGELADELKTKYSNKKNIIVGDGAELFYEFVKEFEFVKLAVEPKLRQNAVGVGLLGEKLLRENNFVLAKELLPKYLRLPQAERELNNKKEQGK